MISPATAIPQPGAACRSTESNFTKKEGLGGYFALPM
jgi:hypothetical protein